MLSRSIATDTAVTLDLAVDVRGPAGTAAPAGMFTVDSSRVTMPARGSASVQLVTDTSVPAPDGVYGGVLLATAVDGHTEVRTPVGVVREVESYDVAMTFLDHNGERAASYWPWLVGIDNPTSYSPYDPSGTVVAPLPKGRYVLDASIQTGSQGEEGFLDTLVSEPTLTVTGDTTLTFDARDGKKFGATVDRPATQRVLTWLGFARQTEWGGASSSYSGWDMAHLRVRPSATQAPADQFEFRVRTTLAAPDGSGGVRPCIYNIQWSSHGRVPTDLTPRVRDRELAIVHTELAATGGDKKVGKDNPLVAFPTPAKITEYFTPGVPWYGEWAQYGLDDPEWPEGWLSAAGPRTYQLGRPVVERWYVGVFGPAFPAGRTWVGRRGNEIGVDGASLLTDHAPDRYGFFRMDSSRTTLYRDGQKIGETSDGGSFQVPADPATYRLEVESTRSISDLSTRVSSAWTFHSPRGGARSKGGAAGAAHDGGAVRARAG